MKTKFTKVLTMLVCICMLATTIPAMTFAATETDFKNSQLAVVNDKTSTLATGVTQDAYTVYNRNGEQVKMFITVADMNVDTVEVFASYRNMDPTNYGMSKLTEQVAAFDKKVEAGDEYYKGTVVAGINASYYNMSTGKPTGTFVMNGIDVTTEAEGNQYGYFAVMKDGSVKIGKPGEYSSDKGNIQEAIGIYKMLIEDGKIVAGLDDVTKYPRQTIGITADNKVVVMTADGNQAPTSVGLTYYEQAAVMYDMGCVWAGHLDGGGSATYGSKPEGSDTFVITNSPADGSERSVSNGFFIVSTEAVSYEFDRVALNVESEYITPGTSIDVSVKGVSSTGNAAEIPENVTYEVKNGTYADGKFVAADQTGTATIRAIYNGKVVGEATIHVVIPETISFAYDNIVVPYEKTLNLAITATVNNGLNKVTLKDDDIIFTLSDSKLGTIVGTKFTACSQASGIKTGTVTAKYAKDTTISAKATLTFGRGSEIAYDFEDGDTTGFSIYSGYLKKNPKYGRFGKGSFEIVTKDNGKVKNGENALAVTLDYSNFNSMGWKSIALDGLNVDLTDAVGVGMWVYIPADAVGFVEIDFNNDVIVDSYVEEVQSDDFDGGWFYVRADGNLGGKLKNLYFYQQHAYENAEDDVNIMTKFTIYIDDITVDYSNAVDDRELPTVDKVYVAYEGLADAAEMKGQTITTNKIFASTRVNDNTEIDWASLKVYVDGVALDSDQYTYNHSGIVSTDELVLADGAHTFTFAVSDILGNERIITRTIVIDADSDMDTVMLVPKNPEADRVPIGSVQWYDLVATDISKIDVVTTTIDLDNMSKWQLDHMEVAEGFEAEYVLNTFTNDATITITRVGDVDKTGEAVLVSLPIRTWEHINHLLYPNDVYTGTATGDADQANSPHTVWKTDAVCHIAIVLNVDYGHIKFVDGTDSTFSSEEYVLDTEMFFHANEKNSNADIQAIVDSKYSFHVHTPVAIVDKEATCTEDGYTGRTVCMGCSCGNTADNPCDSFDGCGSVVDWGTKIPKTGHTYVVVNGVLQCEDGDKLFNGVYTDGKTYIDGVVAAGWVEDSYYVEGLAVTGIYEINGVYYNFGDNGVSMGKYHGLLEIDGNMYFSKLGVLCGGWIDYEGDWYYFDEETLTTVTEKTFTYEYGHQATYQFYENGKVVSGDWVEINLGTRYYYGPAYYKLTAKRGNAFWVTIDGNLYAFDGMGIRHEGMSFIIESNNPQQLMVFSDEGVYQEIYTGMYEGKYYENGYICPNKGLIEYEGDYYYIISSGKTYVGTLFVTEAKANGLVKAKKYTFAEDGKMIIEPAKNGIIDGKYYVNDEVVPGVGMVEVDGDLYFITMSGKVYTNGTLAIGETKANGLVKPGKHTFGADGKMIIEPAKNGIVDGKYYVDDELITGVGMVEVDGDLYFVTMSGKVYTNGTLAIGEAKANGLVKPGKHSFGADGKMIIEPAKNGIVDGRYYVDDELVTSAGVVEVDGALYYITASGKVYVGSISIGEAKTNGLIDAGSYTTDASGKLIIE